MTVTITKEENEKALECVLRSRGFSKRLITRLKRTENGMTRKGVLIRTVDLVYENDIIMINEGDGEALDPNPDLKADILYEDSEVVVFSKPPFMPCHPSIKHRDDTLGNLFAALYPSLAFRPVNRLDRNTSGLVLAGKSMQGSRELSQMIKDRTLEKYYITVAKGKIEHDSSVCGLLIKDEASNKVSVRPLDTDTVVESDERFIRTDYRVLGHGEDYTVLEVHLITGRPHQIRAHLAMLNHPVLGDYKYGDRRINEKYKLKDQLLHAYRIVLPGGREYRAVVPPKLELFTRGIL